MIHICAYRELSTDNKSCVILDKGWTNDFGLLLLVVNNAMAMSDR